MQCIGPSARHAVSNCRGRWPGGGTRGTPRQTLLQDPARFLVRPLVGTDGYPQAVVRLLSLALVVAACGSSSGVEQPGAATLERFEVLWGIWSAEGQATICRGIEIDGSAEDYIRSSDFAGPDDDIAQLAILMDSECDR